MAVASQKLDNLMLHRFSTPVPSDQLQSAIAQEGCCIVEQVVDDATVDVLRNRIDEHESFAIRNLAREISAVADVAESSTIRAIVDSILGSEAFLMRSILFDKTPQRNWHVGWHQDTAIAVQERVDVPEFGPWSVKAGVQHARPTIAVLDQLLTVRLHLDRCDADNGALRTQPGQHNYGFLEPEVMVKHAATHGCAMCSVSAGDAVVIRPMVPHASSPAVSPTRRRVVHLEFAAGALPGGLAFHREL